ncbi:MAG: AAA family ATPase, partial [Mycobacteriaceae bacterium]|nr:AAA family ATPase [Mycobacteriaceae bacterium]
VAPAPAARPAAPLAIGLRAAPTLLLGREADLNALDMLLDTARVVTVLGPGGTGKTRVANEIGLRRGSALPVVLVELAAVRSGEDVVAAISSVLGLGEVERAKPTSLAPTRIHTPMQRLRDALSERPSLLILDNCEHLIEAAAEVVADLVTSCEGLRVLTTSRSPLMIAAESVYPLAPLQIDEHGSPATELFMSRARAVRPSVRLEPGHVARLCRTLDGLPLAIELAAARVRTMSVEEINAGLSQRFSLLRSGDRTSPWRHRTLHAVIDWSWNLLDESQQAALRRLCRFPAGFTMAAARAAAGWGEAEDIEFAVEGLVNQSLLTVIEDQGGQGIRYRMLETVREYGEEQLAAAVEADDVMRRMAVWAQDFTSEQLVVFRAGRQADAVRAMLAEQENLLAVLRHQILEGRANRPVYQVFAALGGLWLLRGHHSELVSWSPRIIELGPLEADVPFDVATSALTLIAGHLMLVGSVRDAVRARIWLRRLLADPGEHTEVALFQARMLCWPVRDHRGLARMLARSARSADRATRLAALIVRANAHENNGSIAASLRDALVALPIAEAVGDVHSATMACQHIAGVYGQTARYREAAEYYRRGVAGFRQLHAHDEADQYAIFMAGALIGSGSIAEARQVLDSISPEMEREADGPGRADAFSSRRREILWSARGELLLAEGDVERGLADHRRALAASQWPAQGGLVGPFGLLLAAGMAGAHILHGRLAEVSTTIAEMADYMDRQFAQPFSDVPQLGAAVVAVGSYRIAAGVADDTGVELLALAPRLQPRQDLPSMLLERHHRAARAVVGDAAFDAALRRAARLPRAAAIPRALELLRKRP